MDIWTEKRLIHQFQNLYRIASNFNFELITDPIVKQIAIPFATGSRSSDPISFIAKTYPSWATTIFLWTCLCKLYITLAGIKNLTERKIALSGEKQKYNIFLSILDEVNSLNVLINLQPVPSIHEKLEIVFSRLSLLLGNIDYLYIEYFEPDELMVTFLKLISQNPASDVLNYIEQTLLDRASLYTMKYIIEIITSSCHNQTTSTSLYNVQQIHDLGLFLFNWLSLEKRESSFTLTFEINNKGIVTSSFDATNSEAIAVSWESVDDIQDNFGNFYVSYCRFYECQVSLPQFYTGKLIIDCYPALIPDVNQVIYSALQPSFVISNLRRRSQIEWLEKFDEFKLNFTIDK
jgi:hypothetical protein